MFVQLSCNILSKIGKMYHLQKIEERRQFYSRALLLFPHHLHEEDSAQRLKSDQQVLNEKQWKVCRDAGENIFFISFYIRNLMENCFVTFN